MIDKDKTYRTRDDREVRIYATDGGYNYPIHGAINCDGEWSSYTWRKDGRFSSDVNSDDDLIEVKPRIKRTVWLNLYDKDKCGSYYSTKEAADTCGSLNRSACVRIEIDCEKGEGL